MGRTKLEEEKWHNMGQLKNEPRVLLSKEETFKFIIFYLAK
jgi:hypothetical protein